MKYYTSLLIKEDLLILKKGKPIMKIVSPNKERQLLVDSLYGIIPEVNDEEIMNDRLY